MRLYHFINAQYGLEDLGEKRLKVADIMELNDPFEFLGVDLSKRKLCKVMEKIKEDLSKICGILCFSKSWDNPMQWSHYADGYKGLCLGFDIPDNLLMKVDYVDERFSADNFLAESKALESKLSGEMKNYIGQPASPDELGKKKAEFLEEARNTLLEEAISDVSGQEDVKKILITKFSHWRHEEEWRLFVPLDNKESDGMYYADFSDKLKLEEVIVGLRSLDNKESDGMYYADFSDKLKLKEVIVGLRSCVTRTQIERELGEIAGSVDIFKACADARKFAVVRDENNAF